MLDVESLGGSPDPGTFDRLFGPEIVHHELHALHRNGLLESRRQLLEHDAPRCFWKLRSNGGALATDATANVDEECCLRAEVVNELLKREGIEPGRFSLVYRIHPDLKVLRLGGLAESPHERMDVDVVAKLECTVRAIRWVFILGIGQKLWEDLPTGNKRIYPGAPERLADTV